MSNSELIKKIPKAELHLHIEGTLEPEMVFQLAERNNIKLPYANAQELAAKYNFSDLQSFLDLYYQATDVLQTEQDFFDLTWAYLEHCAEDNVVHCEIFFDPQSHTSRGVPFADVIQGIHKALVAGEEKLGITSQLILCFLRHLPEEDALKTWDEAQPWLSLISGVGLDSSERDFPPNLFANVFAKAKQAGLKLVAHAGEEGPAQYIEQALDILKIDRIDHGVRITESDELMDRVAKDNIALTVCPLSNVRLCVYSQMQEHPLLELLDRGLRVMINSDDPAYFGGYMNQNFHAVDEALNPSKEQIILLAKNSILASFLTDQEKQTWLDKIDSVAQSN
ncbi:adenosine deaminase [Sessilibacter corallicola]|uniref:adenosine deaminase n=1 Tax=Sessilibacter corallicola TaxID=2904075 RepID=UPI001E52D0DE|nr:adenosine deaminase [Sessilibacter corallicola]